TPVTSTSHFWGSAGLPTGFDCQRTRLSPITLKCKGLSGLPKSLIAAVAENVRHSPFSLYFTLAKPLLSGCVPSPFGYLFPSTLMSGSPSMPVIEPLPRDACPENAASRSVVRKTSREGPLGPRTKLHVCLLPCLSACGLPSRTESATSAARSHLRL